MLGQPGTFTTAQACQIGMAQFLQSLEKICSALLPGACVHLLQAQLQASLVCFPWKPGVLSGSSGCLIELCNVTHLWQQLLVCPLCKGLWCSAECVLK